MLQHFKPQAHHANLSQACLVGVDSDSLLCLDLCRGSPDQHWVQCEECLKWRKLPFTEEPVPEPWYCHLNPDPKCRSCIDPEEPEESEDELTPSYEKTFKKQDLNNDRKRSMSLEGGIVKPELSRGLSGPPNLLTSQEEEQVEGMEKGVAGSSVPRFEDFCFCH
ncbi:UNVERIFIED_CONTAM: hypothetical protein FKN15_010300 [Acipenser sinensis]